MSENSTVIVGGGFAGLFTALHLRHRNYSNPVILIDAQARFVFKPLLYEYLTEEMHEEQVTPTYAELLQGSEIVFIQGNVIQIDLQQRKLILTSGLHYHYQNLVLALGSTQGYFGIQGAQQHAFPFRSRTDVLRLRQHLQSCLQQASYMSDRLQRQQVLTVAVIGAGPSGVEIAATLADLLPAWYCKLGGNVQEIRIVLVNHGQEILAGDINTNLRETVLQALQNRAIPVELMLGVTVESVDPDRLHYRNEDRDRASLMCLTTIWTTGTATHPLIKTLSLAPDGVNKQGQILVAPTLQVPKFPEVFAAGDCAAVQSHPLPPVAQVAYQQGAGIADNLVAISRGKSPQPVEVKLRGTLMKLGIGNGIANLFDKVQIDGQAGDLIRNATYLDMLPSPVHNFKAVREWLTDEIFDRYSSAPTVTFDRRKVQQPNRTLLWICGIAIAAVLGAGLVVSIQSQKHSPSKPQPIHRQSNL